MNGTGISTAAVLLLLVLCTWFAYGSLVRWPAKKALVPFLLRIGALGLLAFLVSYPSLVRRYELVERPSLLVLIDSSASMSLPSSSPASAPSTRAVTAPSRFERAVAAVRRLRRAYSGDFILDVRTFSSMVAPFVEGTTVPAGDATDIAAALARAVSNGGRRGTRAVFLLSDGRVTTGGDPRIWARRTPFPIHTVRIGPESMRFRNLSVVSLDAPETAYLGGEIVFGVSIAVHGEDGGAEKLPLVLYENGREVARRVVSPSGSERIELACRPSKTGLLVYEARLGAIDGELTEVDNSGFTAVYVRKEPNKVLLCSGAPSPELAFFRREIERDRRFELTSVVRALKGKRLDVQPSRLRDLSVLVIHGFRAASYRPDFLEAAVDFVKNDGGGVIFLGIGKEQAADLLASPFGPILPFRMPSEQAQEGRVSCTVAGNFRTHPLLRVLPHPQANLQAWRNLPPILPGCASVEVRPGAVAPLRFLPGRTGTPVFTYRSLGSGVLVCFNTCEMWRWKLGGGLAARRTDVFSTFVGNLLSWVSDRARSGGLRLKTDTLRYAAGDPVTASLEDFRGSLRSGVGLELRCDGPFPLRSQALAALRGTPGTSAVVPSSSKRLPLTPNGDGWSVRFVPPGPGRYELSFRGPGGRSARSPFIVVGRGGEFTEPSADVGLLHDISVLSGGRSISEGEDPASVHIDDRPKTTVTTSSIFWLDEWWVLVLLLTLLCAEWGARRFYLRI